MEASAAVFAPGARARRRKIVNRAVEVIAVLASAAAIAVLVLVIVSIARRGAPAIDWDFFTKSPAGFGEPGGGIAPAIVGSAVIVLFATLMALPVGVLCAIWISEFAPRRVAGVVRIALDVLNGLPTIVFGIFVFSLVVVAHGQSALAASFALAIVMLPLIARATQEVLRLVPASLREAGLALGASRWRTVVGVILPTTLGGILTGTTLAIARAAGETAPLLFTSSIVIQQVDANPRHALQSIPVTIFELSESADPADHARAWAAALVLLTFVLVSSLAARALLARSRRKLTR